MVFTIEMIRSESTHMFGISVPGAILPIIYILIYTFCNMHISIYYKDMHKCLLLSLFDIELDYHAFGLPHNILYHHTLLGTHTSN